MAVLERVADTFSSLRTINRFFCHYFRILPENPRDTDVLEHFS